MAQHVLERDRVEREDAPEAEDAGLVLGRPVEDRSFEAVEAAAGIALGIAVGATVAGPIGAVVGGIAGAAVGITAGEALERAEGRAARTTDATVPAHHP